jgi:hypothetical protein
VGLDQAKFLEVAGKRSLSDAHFLRGKAATQLFLVGDALIGDQAEDLSVPKCLVRVHEHPAQKRRMYFYTLVCILMSTDFAKIPASAMGQEHGTPGKRTM